MDAVVTRRLGSLVAALLLVAGLSGMPTRAVAATPVAVGDSIVVQKNAPTAVIDVLANDTVDPADTITLTSNPTHGSSAMAGGGVGVTYKPDAAYTGVDSFTYTVTNDPDGDATATVSVVVNAPPNAANDTKTLSEDAPATAIDVLANDTFAPDTDETLTITAKTNGAKGTVAISDGGSGLTYAPNPNATGADSFTYTISDGHGGTDSGTVNVTITAVNDPPTAVGDSATVIEDSGPNAITVLSNDSDPENDSLTVTGVSAAVKGTPAIATGGTGVTYTPSANANGADTFTYTVSDGHGGTDVGTVNVTITPLNDAPDAVNDTLNVTEDDLATAVNPLSNDTIAPDSGETLTITSTTAAAKGSVAITGGGSGISYAPIPNANGADSFTYTIGDGNGGADTATVIVTITAVDDLPVAVDDAVTIDEDAVAAALDVTANDSEVDGEALIITARTNGAKGTVTITGAGTGLTYTPSPSATGADSFTYTISDGHHTSSATVSVSISPTADPPVAVNDTKTLLEDAAATTVDVLANDSDPDGDPLVVTDKTNGAKGVVTILAGGTGVSYKPNANVSGTDTFTYTVTDGTATDIGTVTVTITPVNDPPNAVNDGVPTPTVIYLNAGARAIPVLANDTSAPDPTETLRITAKTNGSHGLVTITGGGTGLTYTPTGTATGIDVFTYTVSDGHGGFDTASVQVRVLRDVSGPKAAITGLTKSTIRGSTKLRLRLTWTLTETQSGIRSELLQRRTDAGSYVTIALSSSAVRSMFFTVSRHHTYTFRLRAVDKAGNTGAFVSRIIRI